MNRPTGFLLRKVQLNRCRVAPRGVIGGLGIVLACSAFGNTGHLTGITNGDSWSVYGLKQTGQDMPAEPLTFYREISTEVKKMASREKVGVRTYWIGKAIRERLKTGVLRLGIVVRPQYPAPAE